MIGNNEPGRAELLAQLRQPVVKLRNCGGLAAMTQTGEGLSLARQRPRFDPGDILTVLRQRRLTAFIPSLGMVRLSHVIAQEMHALLGIPATGSGVAWHAGNALAATPRSNDNREHR